MKAAVLAMVVAWMGALAAGCGSRDNPAGISVFTDAESGVSICVPDKWTKLKSTTDSIGFFGGPIVGGSRQTIMIQRATDSRTLEEFVQRSLNELQGIRKSYIELDRSPFETSSHMKGIRLVVEGSPVSSEIRMSRCYFFALGDAKYWVIMSRSDAYSPPTDVFFDEIAKTFDVRR